jgi:GT2 family glycosyltransferase
MADVSAIVVNYNTGAYVTQLVAGLRRETITRRDGRPGTLEIVVVENASPSDQSPWLAPLERAGVKVVRAPANLGYAGGNNLGVRHATGDKILILNPDVLIVPGAVDALARHLDLHPRAGQVGPRGWIDSHRFLYLPRIELPTLATQLAEAWRRTSRRRAEAFALRRTKNALRVWSATRPQEEPVLAGYAFMMPADLARRLGPFDDRFPLYYEDSDLSRRVREAGRECVLVPEAEMVHLFNKSAGQFAEEAARKHDLSLALYLRKHYGSVGGFVGRRVFDWTRAHPTQAGAHEFARCVDLGGIAEPPLLAPTRPAERYVAELTIDPLFSLAVGRIDTRPTFEIPRGTWEHLDPTDYYVRFLSLPELRPIGAWRFRKTAPLRPVASDADFLDRLVDSHPPAELVA